MKKILILLIAICTTGTTFAQSNHKCNDNKVTDCSGSVKDVTIKVGGSYTPSGIKAGESKCDQCGENVKKHKITYSSKRTDSPTRSSSFSFMSRSGSSGSGGVNIDTSKPGTYEVTATCSEGCSGLGSGTVEVKPKCSSSGCTKQPVVCPHDCGNGVYHCSEHVCACSFGSPTTISVCDVEMKSKVYDTSISMSGKPIYGESEKTCTMCNKTETVIHTGGQFEFKRFLNGVLKSTSRVGLIIGDGKHLGTHVLQGTYFNGTCSEQCGAKSETVRETLEDGFCWDCESDPCKCEFCSHCDDHGCVRPFYHSGDGLCKHQICYKGAGGCAGSCTPCGDEMCQDPDPDWQCKHCLVGTCVLFHVTCIHDSCGAGQGGCLGGCPTCWDCINAGNNGCLHCDDKPCTTWHGLCPHGLCNSPDCPLAPCRSGCERCP